MNIEGNLKMNGWNEGVRIGLRICVALFLVSVGGVALAHEGHEHASENPQQSDTHSVAHPEAVPGAEQEMPSHHAVDGANGSAEQSGPGQTKHLIEFLGKFHPLVVHFPVAFVFGAFLAELLFLVSSRSLFSDAARFTIVLGALSVILAVILGWFDGAFADFVGPLGRTLAIHRWLGTASGLLVIITAAFSELSRRSSEKARFVAAYRILLVITCCIMALTGHFGAMLTHGIDYFKW